MASQESVAARLIASLMELKRVSEGRRRLRPGTPAYDTAMDEEMRVVTQVRELIEEQRREEAGH